MKKLLHIALGVHNVNMQQCFDAHFNTVHYDWTTKQNNVYQLNQDVIKLATKFKPDVVFMQLQADNILTPYTVQYLSSIATTVLFNGDVRSPIPKWEFELGKLVDCTLHTNTHYVDELTKKGINARHIFVGYDDTIFTKNGATGNYPPIIFLGSNYLNGSNFPLSACRQEMVTTLKKRYGANFEAYGHNWNHITNSHKYLNLNEEAAAYRSCKIAINLSHFNYGRYSSDRMVRMMGSGAFCLTHHYKDIETDYEVGKHLDTWTTIHDLTKKIDYYLTNDKLRNTIQQKGYLHTVNNFTWNCFMIELKNIIGL